MTASKSKERDAACLQQLFTWQRALSPRDATTNTDYAWNAMNEKTYMADRLLQFFYLVSVKKFQKLNIKGFYVGTYSTCFF